MFFQRIRICIPSNINCSTLRQNRNCDIISARDFAVFICFFSWTFVTLDGGGSGFWCTTARRKTRTRRSSQCLLVTLRRRYVCRSGSEEHVCSLTTIPSFLECAIRFGSFSFVVEVTAAAVASAAVVVIEEIVEVTSTFLCPEGRLSMCRIRLVLFHHHHWFRGSSCRVL
jgi:hypothetical protein